METNVVLSDTLLNKLGLTWADIPYDALNRPTAKLAIGYYRLSVEEFKRGESSSIKNQREIVRQYCKDNGIILVKEFDDDGYSGANFDRPGFKNLLAYLDKGLANMVITKDLSRLGRDMTESSFYAEKIFPEKNIHYIAISDNFDSNDVNIMAPFQFAMNDVYIRDTSRKIKQVLNQKRSSGEYCACPPFGYMKNPNNSGTLVPDPSTAHIVQRIFELANDGKSAYTIAKILTNEGVITPLKYRVMCRDNFSEKGAARASDVWNHITVKRILKNPVYLGHTILGKEKKASLKSKKKVPIPQEEWCVTQNTHTPLVTQEVFDKAEYYMGMHTKDWRKSENSRLSVFKGIVFCSKCGAAMCSGGTVYNGERDKYWYLVCNNISSSSKKCTHGARIKYSDLVDIVKNELNQLISLTDDDIKEITNAALKRSGENNVYSSGQDSLKAIDHRLEQIDKIILKLYNDNISGTIDDSRLSTMVADLTKEAESLKEKAFKLRKLESSENTIVDAYDTFFKLAKEYNHIDELTERIVKTFIERIDIGGKELPEGYRVATHDIPYKQSIKITYRFIGNIQNDDYIYKHPLATSEKIAV